jgi:ABC-2 type transport system permease protein
MNKILIVMRHEFLTLVTKPSFWFSLIGLPIFMGGIMAISLLGSGAATAATIASKQNETTAQGYVDQSGLITQLPSGTQLTAYADEATALSALQGKQITGYFLVPADYIEKGVVTYISPEFSPINSPTGVFERVLKYNLVKGDETKLARAEATLVIQEQTALAPKGSNGGTGMPFPIVPMFAGILFMIVMLTASSYLMQTVTTEKESRVMEVLMSSISPTQMLAGKIAGLGLVGFIQMALWLISSVSALNIIPAATGLGIISTSAILVMVVYFILGYFIYASLMAGLGALMPGSREAAQYTFFILLPLIAPMYVISAIVLEPNGPLAVILSLFPLSAPVVMVMRVTSTDVPFIQILFGIVLMIVTVVLAVILVARLFRAQSLLRGTKPSLKEIVLSLK